MGDEMKILPTEHNGKPVFILHDLAPKQVEQLEQLAPESVFTLGKYHEYEHEGILRQSFGIVLFCDKPIPKEVLNARQK